MAISLGILTQHFQTNPSAILQGPFGLWHIFLHCHHPNDVLSILATDDIMRPSRYSKGRSVKEVPGLGMTYKKLLKMVIYSGITH